MSAKKYAGFTDYTIEFQGKLTDVVCRSLGIDNPMLAELRMGYFFPAPFCAVAAKVGFEMGLPTEAAIALFVVFEAVSFESRQNWFSLKFNSKISALYNEYRAMSFFVKTTADAYAGNANQFSQLLIKGCSKL